MSDSETRLGRNGAEEVKSHPYFRGIDWDRVREMQAPNVPQVTSEISAENFDKFDEDKLAMEDRKFHKRHGIGGKQRFDYDFIGYTYKSDVEQEKMMLVNVLKDLDTIITNDSLQTDQHPSFSSKPESDLASSTTQLQRALSSDSLPSSEETREEQKKSKFQILNNFLRISTLVLI